MDSRTFGTDTYKELNDFEHAFQDLAKAIAINPKYAAAYNNRGLLFASQNDYTRAIREYDEAIRADPNDAFAFNNRGDAKLKLGDLTGSQMDLARGKALLGNSGMP